MSEPSKEQFAKFLKCFHDLAHFEATQRQLRGWGAFDLSEWKEMPDPDVVSVYRWIIKRSKDEGLSKAEGTD